MNGAVRKMNPTGTRYRGRFFIVMPNGLLSGGVSRTEERVVHSFISLCLPAITQITGMLIKDTNEVKTTDPIAEKPIISTTE